MTSWEYFWSKYLIWSIRVCCYFTNFYLFSAMINSLTTVESKGYYFFYGFVLCYSILCSELISRFIAKGYKPKFLCEDEIKGKQLSGELVLSRKEYDYRVMAEKLIYEMIWFFGINLSLAVVLGFFSSHSNIQTLLIGAFCGMGSAYVLSAWSSWL